MEITVELTRIHAEVHRIGYKDSRARRCGGLALRSLQTVPNGTEAMRAFN